MCKAMEDMRNEAAKEAEYRTAVKSARRMLADNFLSIEKIAQYTNLSVKEVEALRGKEPA